MKSILMVLIVIGLVFNYFHSAKGSHLYGGSIPPPAPLEDNNKDKSKIFLQKIFDDLFVRYNSEDKTQWNAFLVGVNTIEELNDKVDNIPYSLLNDFGDRWNTPQDLIAFNHGDCIDYTVAKYFALQQMGYSEHRLRILAVSMPDDTVSGLSYHAILVIDGVEVLDNRYGTIRSMKEAMSEYTVEYSVNKESAIIN